jgi:hypothetical protein
VRLGIAFVSYGRTVNLHRQEDEEAYTRDASVIYGRKGALHMSVRQHVFSTLIDNGICNEEAVSLINWQSALSLVEGQ